MTDENIQKLTLDQPTTYQIKVPGHLDESWFDWVDNCTMLAETDPDRLPITTLTGTFDQAALIGILRRFYSLGLPLISVTWLEI